MNHFEVDRLKEVYRNIVTRLGKTKWRSQTSTRHPAERERKLEQLLHGRVFSRLGTAHPGCGCARGKFAGFGGRTGNLFALLLAERIRRARENFPEMTFQEPIQACRSERLF